MENPRARSSILYIFCDGPKTAQDAAAVASVRAHLENLPATAFQEIHILARQENLGLAPSIIEGVTRTLEKHDRVIVLEDDLLTASSFLDYMNEALEIYACDNAVFSVQGWCYPTKPAQDETYFLRGADCWGWATWRRAWQHFEPDSRKLLQQLQEQHLTRAFDMEGAYPFTRMLEKQAQGLVSSWAIRWHASAFLHGALALYPTRSLVQNIGFGDAQATHTSSARGTDIYAMPINFQEKIQLQRIPLTQNALMQQRIISLLKRHLPTTFLGKVIKRIRTYFPE